MLTGNNQIFRNWFVIIHRHLTKVSARIIHCIILERNELSITQSTLWVHLQEIFERVAAVFSLGGGYLYILHRNLMHTLIGVA